MFDYHMHTTVSFDGKSTAVEMVQAAQAAGLKEICFTDHMDYCHAPHAKDMISPTITARMTGWPRPVC